MSTADNPVRHRASGGVGRRKDPPEATGTDDGIAHLQTDGVTKRFGELTALENVNFSIHHNEIHGLLGENGAGKSTLMKVLYGVHQPDEGNVRLKGKPVEMTPSLAKKNGVGLVFQDFRLVPALTVWENVAMALSEVDWTLDQATIVDRIEQVSERFNFDVNPDSEVWKLDVGQQQRVEIIKVLLQEPELLILDEPTSVLTVNEVDPFLEKLLRLRDEGFGIVFVTHKLRELREVCDRLTVLRNGKVVSPTETFNELSDDQLVAKMVGDEEVLDSPSEVVPRSHEDQIERDDTLLSISNLTLENERGPVVLRDADLNVYDGEIVGVAGISGNGQKELAEALSGLTDPVVGSITKDGRDLTGTSPQTFLDNNVVCLPQDPVEESLVPDRTVLEHMVLGGRDLQKNGFRSIDWKSLGKKFNQLNEVDRLDVDDHRKNAEDLSGGNLQRLMLARALVRDPELFIACYPSRGIDFATIETIHDILLSMKDEGTSTLLFSEDLHEIMKITHRLYVLADQKLLGPYQTYKVDVQTVGRCMMTGEPI